jgi:ferric iron reductase protein FhuF
MEKFNDIREKELEKYFNSQYENIQDALSFVNILKDSLINTYGEFNKKIKPDEVERVLCLISSRLNPVATELGELGSNPNYLFWDNKNKVKKL